MRILFGVIASLLFVSGFLGCAAAKSSIHEIYWGIVFVIGTLFFVGAGIMTSIEGLREDLRKVYGSKT